MSPLINNETQANKNICDAVGCSQKATTNIKLSAGRFGEIIISTCDKCVHKFE